MAQVLVPTADQATGSWTTAPLFSKISEDPTTFPDGDGTTIASNNNINGDNADLKVTSGVTPDTGDVTLNARWNKSAAGGHTVNAVMELWEGIPSVGTLRATLSVPNIGETEVGSSYTLSAGERAAISNWSNLYIRLSRQGSTGGAGGTRRSLVVDRAHVETPDPPAPPPITDSTLAHPMWGSV